MTAQFSISLVLGDWSHDGHEKTETVIVMSNMSKQDVQKAYENGTKIVGFDLVKEVCCKYEDNVLEWRHYDRLKELGRDEGFYYEEEATRDNRGIHLEPDEFAQLYMFIATVGNVELMWEFAELAPSIHIGGYGLFFS